MSEVDALLAALTLVIGIAGGYAAVRYVLAGAVIKAVGTLVAVIQTIRSAKSDGVFTDAELIQIGRGAVQLDADCGDCWIIARPK